MPKKLFLVLGNGFTIDLLKHIGHIDKIDVANLFKQGAEVPWPVTGNRGFLSFKHCPNLWSLGARPTMNQVDSSLLIEDIITCANIDASKRKVGGTLNPNNIYGKAYKELIEYLRHLFVYYDQSISDIPDSILEWSWYKIIKSKLESSDFSEITIVSYNYDCWLERIFDKFSIPFRISSIDGNDHTKKVTLIKPHGSISFIHKEALDLASYSIRYDSDLSDGSMGDFTAQYSTLARNHLVTALIPPAGESDRFKHTWSTQLRMDATSRASTMTSLDEIIICGMSYWHVDRIELDELFNRFDPQAEICLVNPNPNRTLIAVLTSSFPKFILYPDANALCP